MSKFFFGKSILGKGIDQYVMDLPMQAHSNNMQTHFENFICLKIMQLNEW